MQYFPDRIAAGHLPDRDYFWNIINTLHEEYVQRIIRRAREQRHTQQADQVQQEMVQVSNEWMDLLGMVPYASRKY